MSPFRGRPRWGERAPASVSGPKPGSRKSATTANVAAGTGALFEPL